MDRSVGDGGMYRSATRSHGLAWDRLPCGSHASRHASRGRPLHVGVHRAGAWWAHPPTVEVASGVTAALASRGGALSETLRSAAVGARRHGARCVAARRGTHGTRSTAVGTGGHRELGSHGRQLETGGAVASCLVVVGREDLGHGEDHVGEA